MSIYLVTWGHTTYTINFVFSEFYVYRWLYWTDVNTDTIERISMDGTSRTVLHSTGLSRTFGITLDYVTQTLYWIDYDTDTIESSTTDGSNRRLLTRVSSSCPYDLTIFDQKLYWTDHCHRAIFSTVVNQLNGGNRILYTGNYPYRLHVVTQDRQPILGNYINIL